MVQHSQPVKKLSKQRKAPFFSFAAYNCTNFKTSTAKFCRGDILSTLRFDFEFGPVDSVIYVYSAAAHILNQKNGESCTKPFLES